MTELSSKLHSSISISYNSPLYCIVHTQLQRCLRSSPV